MKTCLKKCTCRDNCVDYIPYKHISWGSGFSFSYCFQPVSKNMETCLKRYTCKEKHLRQLRALQTCILKVRVLISPPTSRPWVAAGRCRTRPSPRVPPRISYARPSDGPTQDAHRVLISLVIVTYAATGPVIASYSAPSSAPRRILAT